MDKKQCETSIEAVNTADTNLPAVVAGLEMLTVKDASTENRNRRCSLRPRKRPFSEIENNNSNKGLQEEKKCDSTKLSVKGSIKRKLNSLETIYEEKDDTNEGIIYMSVKRYKRMIQFQEQPTDSKLRKRRAKIKRVFGSKIHFKRKYISMQVLLDKLNGIRAETSTKVDNEAK
ncbi:uncharacterized protein LOC143425917 [Xylocopa sonorina]|uniref:uncharacterized protein LOC143425917 n=1 Tax=Xylocopa sonorina TaxID=1818115 RepID=UPI00403B255D